MTYALRLNGDEIDGYRQMAEVAHAVKPTCRPVREPGPAASRTSAVARAPCWRSSPNSPRRTAP